MNQFPAANDAEASIEDVLVFVTGASRPPPLGFDEPAAITFSDDEPFPMANTCSNTIRLPVCYSEYEEFKRKMILRLKIPHALDTLEQYTFGILLVLIDNKCPRVKLKYFIDVRNNCS